MSKGDRLFTDTPSYNKALITPEVCMRKLIAKGNLMTPKAP